MKAIVFTQYGSPDLLELKDVAKPTPKGDEVLIKVHASSINSWDWEFQSGTTFINRLLFGLFRPKPEKQILGADIAGTVEKVGKNVTRFQPGDEVFGDLWDSWGGSDPVSPAGLMVCPQVLQLSVLLQLLDPLQLHFLIQDPLVKIKERARNLFCIT